MFHRSIPRELFNPRTSGRSAIVDRTKVEKFGVDVCNLAAEQGLTTIEMVLALAFLIEATRRTVEENHTVGGNA